MSVATSTRLLAFARELQQAATFGDLVELARKETRAALGYGHAWLLVAEDETVEYLRLIDAAGDRRQLAWELCPRIPTKGDAMIEAMLQGAEPVVVADARTDPRVNRELVALMGNRTIINLPLRLMEGPLGFFGTGTFGDEGVRVPTPADLDYLVGMASQLTVAAARIRLQEIERQAAADKKEFERRLAQAQRLESVGLLAGGVAHDFNNLLTVILSSARLAEAMAPRADVAAELAAICDAAKRGAALTRQLLAVGRNQPLALGTFEINAVLRELMALLKRVIPENIATELVPRAGELAIEGDRSQLDQMFMNLCLNARDAMPAGGRLTLETEQVLVNGHFALTHPWAKPGRYVLVTVTDNGLGMAADVVDRIFDPFFSTRHDRGGTGLGLTVAYGVVRQHAGMLHCYSEPGIGTTFKVYLPLSARPAAAVGAKLHAPVVGGSERILLAEDDANIRSLAQRVLAKAGYMVETVANGEAACAAVAEGAFDLVVLDMVMPGPPCREVLARMKSARPGLRVVLSSGYAADGNVTQLVRDECVGFLAKPYDPDGMLATMRSALDR